MQQNDSLQQLLTLGGISLGNTCPEQWSIKQKNQVDFFDLKNDVASILKLFGHDQIVQYIPTAHPALHPGRSAQINIADIPIGVLGEIHPKIKQELDLTKNICLFAINLDLISSEFKKTFHEFSKFPKIHRDIAIVVDKKIVWQQIKQKIVDISGELLHNIELFDIYLGEGVGTDKKSMAIHLIFQSVTRTLVDTEIDTLVTEIICVLKQKFAASLRG